MLSRNVLFIVAFLVVGSSSRSTVVELADTDRCLDPNAVYTDCGTACPLTCANRLNPPGACITSCVQGCFCKPGYFKNLNGTCVPAEDCECPDNEELHLCPSSCWPDTCDSIYKPYECPPMEPKMCQPDCRCKPDYMRNSLGVCIPLEQCRESCVDPNSEFSNCGSACPLTCDILSTGDIPCIDMCVKGCFCKAGFVLNSDGVCILENQCAEAKCIREENTVFAPCGDTCPITCENKDKKPRGCLEFCLLGGGCQCKDGYVRDANNKCILPKDCR